MYRMISLTLVLALLLNAGAESQQLAVQRVKPGEWIGSWLICGPIPLERYENPSQAYDHLRGFTTDYLESAGGENKLHVRAGDVLKYKNGTATWRLYQSPDSVIDLEKAFSGRDYALAYAYTEVRAERAGVWLLGLGTDDGGSVWVNGLKVWDSFLCRSVSADDDLVPVMLNKGKNTLLVKSEQWEWHWGFCMRFLPFGTDDLLERYSFFTLSTGLDGVPMLTSGFDAPVLEQLVGSLEIRIFDSRGKLVFKEGRDTGFCGRIGLVPGAWQAYRASIGITLKNGEFQQQEVDFYAGERSEYTLFSDGESAYRIALGRDASASEQWAAGELQHWLKEISGVELPVGEVGEGSPGPEIIIGYNDLVREKTGAEVPADGDESFRYFNEGPDIFIYGGRERGTMYGVMSFLENEFGCRWYTPEVSVIPHRERMVFDRFDHSERPGIRVRNDFYFEAFDPLWAARNKMNGSLSLREQPGGLECYWGVHTYYQLVPPSEFYEDHPEYYSLIDGKRDYSYGQLCLSNPDVLKIVTERIKQTMRENPGYLIYDISQNDWLNPCQCGKCQAIVKQEGSESGIVLWFVNRVAEAVGEEFPGKYIGTLAYQYTRTPPAHIRPRDNVVVRLCSVECCFAHDFRSCPENRSFLRDLEGWSAIAPNLYIWDYVVNFRHYLMPYPNFKVLQPNIRTLRDNHVIGIMEQGASVKDQEFNELRTYLISKLLWDPDCNADEVIDDFMSGYYGRSGRYIRRYFDLLQGSVTPETHMHIYDNLAFDEPVFSDRFIRESYEIFEEAKKVADNGEILERVERASLPLLYLKCLRMPRLAKYDGSYASFCAITEREGIKYFGGSTESQRIAFQRFMDDLK